MNLPERRTTGKKQFSVGRSHRSAGQPLSAATDVSDSDDGSKKTTNFTCFFFLKSLMYLSKTDKCVFSTKGVYLLRFTVKNETGLIGITTLVEICHQHDVFSV